MVRNYFIVFTRQFRRDIFFAIINVAGLASGLVACFFISIYVIDEFSFDRFHSDYGNIYRVGLHSKLGMQDNTIKLCNAPLAEAVFEQIPGIEETVRVAAYGHNSEASVKVFNNAFLQKGVFYADSNFFNFFSFKLIKGTPNNVLRNLAGAVITKSVAIRLFGSEDVIGMPVMIGDENDLFEVTGLAEDPPHNSHFTFSILLSAKSNPRLQSDSWLSNFTSTYIRKTPAVAPAVINEKLKELTWENVAPKLRDYEGLNFEDLDKLGSVYAYFIFPLKDTHLFTSHINSPIGFETENGNISYIYILAGVGFLILITACINFINLSTAQYAIRAKEVGLRKISGSTRFQLIIRYLLESLCMTMISVSIALVVMYFLIPTFSILSGKNLDLQSLSHPYFILAIAGFIFLIGIGAGSYPAFVLSKINITSVLKGEAKSGSPTLRKTLVVFQFAISIFLLISTWVVYSQVSFIQNRNIGLDKDHVVAIDIGRLKANKIAFQQTVLSLENVEVASFTNNVFPGIGFTTGFNTAFDGKEHVMGTYLADFDHVNVLKLKLASGRFFQRDFPADSMAVVVNEAAVKEAGWNNPVGEELVTTIGGVEGKYKVIGVVSDFNYESLYSEVQPLVIRLGVTSDKLLIRYSDDPKKLIAALERAWKKSAMGEVFEYSFMDENFNATFKVERQTGKVLFTLTFQVIVITMLGMLALASHAADRRAKELSIRKINGATANQLVMFMASDFLKLILIAFIPSAVFGYYCSSEWLSGFSYHVGISPVIILSSGLICVLITLLTISYHSFKVAYANPIDALRHQ